MENSQSEKQKSLLKQIAKYLMEVIIIVVSITLSIYLQDLSNKQEQQEEAKIFLKGLKIDIQEDIEEVEIMLEAYKRFDSTYKYLSTLPEVQDMSDTARFNEIIDNLYDNAFLRPNVSRYEGFKSSGKPGYIKDDSLLHTILYLYQEAIPQLGTSERGWLSQQGVLTRYLTENLAKKADGTPNWYELMTSARGQQYSKQLIPWKQLLERNQQIIEVGKDIIKRIDLYIGLKN